MNTIKLDIRQLNENDFLYLEAIFTDPPFEGEDFESFYAYLTWLPETEILVENYPELSDFSAVVIRMIHEVADDYGNIVLGIAEEEKESEEERKKIVLDVKRLNEDGHSYLKELFSFPDYYGENLDALYDCLCELDPTDVIVKNTDSLKKFSLKILDVFDEVADEYGNIRISYEYKNEEE